MRLQAIAIRLEARVLGWSTIWHVLNSVILNSMMLPATNDELLQFVPSVGYPRIHSFLDFGHVNVSRKSQLHCPNHPALSKCRPVLLCRGCWH